MKNLREIERIIESICSLDIWIKESFFYPIRDEKKSVVVYITRRRTETKEFYDYFIYIYKNVWVYTRYTRKNVFSEGVHEISSVKNALRQYGLQIIIK